MANTTEPQNESKVENLVSVYPNPTTNNITLAVANMATDEELNVIITDALGRKVYQGNLTRTSNLQVPFTNLDAGIYILNAYVKNELVQSNKIIKMK